MKKKNIALLLRPWKPIRLRGCLFWVRSDLGITKDGSDLVSRWADLSGNGRDFIQATGGYQPLYVANALRSRQALRFDGIDDGLFNAQSPDLTGEFTIAATFAKLSNQSPQTRLVLINSSAAAGGVGLKWGFGPTGDSWDRPCMYTYDTEARIVESTFNWGCSPGPSDYHAVIGTYKANDEIELWIDGVSQGKLACGTIGTVRDDFTIAAWDGGSEYGNIDIVEGVCYDRKLNSSEIAQLSNYLRK